MSSLETMEKPWRLCSAFLRAIEEKDYTAVNLILDKGFDIDYLMFSSRTAISICVSNGWYEMAQLLIKLGCSLSLKTGKGETPLHLAVMKSDYMLTKLLVENRADLTSIDLLNKTALHYACELNKLEIATLLIENSTPAIVNMMDKDQRTPLMYACQYGCSHIIKALLSKGAKVNQADCHENSPLLHALSNELCTTEMVNLLLDAGADINHRNTFETPILCIIRLCIYNPKLLDICLLLLERGCDVNVQNYLEERPLNFAVLLKDEVLVRKLLNCGSDANAANSFGFGPLYYACNKGAEKIANLLIDGGAIWDQQLKELFFKQEINSNKTESLSLLFQVLDRLKQCPKLGSLCRTVIRRNLPNNIEKSALLLPLPRFLIRFIQLC